MVWSYGFLLSFNKHTETVVRPIAHPGWQRGIAGPHRLGSACVFAQHYENTPIPIYWKFHHQNLNSEFSDKNSDIFHISAQNIDRGGGSNEKTQNLWVFFSRNKKNNVYPCKPQFYYTKWGLRGSKLYGYVFVMVRSGLLFPSYRVIITKTYLFNYMENFTTKKREKIDKNTDIFHISAQNIDCGYTLEPPHRGGSNEYSQSLFLSRNKKNNVYPCKPQFYYIKVGFKGIKIIHVCFHDDRILHV